MFPHTLPEQSNPNMSKLDISREYVNQALEGIEKASIEANTAPELERVSAEFKSKLDRSEERADAAHEAESLASESSSPEEHVDAAQVAVEALRAGRVLMEVRQQALRSGYDLAA